MSTNPLNDISKVYLDQIAEKKKDDSYLETDMKKRQANNEKARKELAKGPQMKNPHFESVEVEEEKKPLPKAKMFRKAGNLGRDAISTPIDPEKRQKAYDRSKKIIKTLNQNEGLDPVGKEDGDIDNDGDKDSSDKYLLKRRKAIGKAMKKRLKEERESLSEVMDDTEASKEVKEKKVNNKVVINPKLGEAVEEMGGTLIEQIEIDEMDYVIESVYDELIEEGFSEDDVEFGIESALNTLDEGYYDSAVKASKDAAAKIKGETPKKSLKDRVKSAAKKAIFGAGRAVGQAAKAKAAVQAAPGKAKSAMQAKIDKVKRIAKAGYKSGRGPVEKKPTTYRGAGVGRKEKIGEEVVDEAVYGGEPEKKKDTRMVVTNADKKANTPAYQKFKAGDKRYKAADHMGEEASMSPQELMLQKKKARIDKMIAMKRQQGLAKQKAGDAQPAKAMGEETEDSLRDKRMERGGVDGNVRYDKAPKFAPGPKKKSSGSDKAIDFVRKEITAKYGKGALIDTKTKKTGYK
jgi:hypothetical protein